MGVKGQWHVIWSLHIQHRPLAEAAGTFVQEIIQEQITRVLLERLIVNRPHPWGLLITFIELIKNPRYKFWSYSFTHCAGEIERLFESVARSCMGPPKEGGVPDDIAGLQQV